MKKSIVFALVTTVGLDRCHPWRVPAMVVRSLPA